MSPPPSLSAIERGNPPPRRKSCAACIKAKRRCDLRQPACLRCSQRKLSCCYPSQPGAKRSNEVEVAVANTPSLPAKGFSPSEMPPTPWETDFDFSSLDTSVSPSYQHTCSTFPTLSFNEPVFPELSFLDEMNLHHDSMSITPPVPALSTAFEDPMPVAIRSSKFSAVPRIQLLQVVSELVARRLQYTINMFRQAPEKMALTGGTAWSHPALYKDSMPSCLEDALSSCALYRIKSPLNEAVIQRIIETRYQKLISQSVPSSSSANLRDMMARTQALLLYQIMFFFDESHTTRAIVEETRSILLDSALSLAQFISHEEAEAEAEEETDYIPLYPLTAARALFAEYTQRESLRRTLLMGLMFAQLQCILRAEFSTVFCEYFDPNPNPNSNSNPNPDPGPDPDIMSPNPDASTVAAIRRVLHEPPAVENCDSRFLLCGRLTLSAHLWAAREPLEFAVAWREKDHLVATPINVLRLVDESASPDDLDEMGRVLMTTMMGMEEAGAWFASRGVVM
ncbi:hypothetical protein GGS20DRAFT_378808 [Poronia punctata]|nr:hypothetical protein GGS20DRAFT_378808 [Poronia punctata]